MTPAACTGRSTVEVCLPVGRGSDVACAAARTRSLIVMRSTAGLCFERSPVLSRAARGSWSWWSSSLCAEAPSLRATGDQTRARATTAAQSTYCSSVEHWDWNGVSPGTDWSQRLAPGTAAFTCPCGGVGVHACRMWSSIATTLQPRTCHHNS
jgi:hypothetical protein